MSKILISSLATAAFFLSSHLNGALVDHQNKYGDELTSRFILTSDIKTDNLSNIPLRASWWSRPQEYAWAAQFADENALALDAACGISHPFKWHLGETCAQVFALDSDPRIDNVESIVQETYNDLGETAYSVLLSTPSLYGNVTRVRGSICNLPENLPMFDRIFCISTLEHLCDKDRNDAMHAFAKHLSKDGLLVLTVDYPEVTPQTLIEVADSVGLVPAGKVQLDRTSQDLTNGYLSIYRIVFAHRDEPSGEVAQVEEAPAATASFSEWLGSFFKS